MIRTRKECYDYIKENKHLQAEIYNQTGWYYPNLSTEELDFCVEMDYNSLWNRIKRFFRR